MNPSRRTTVVSPFVLILLGLMLSSASALASQYHVRPDGSASGNGSTSSPWNLGTALSHPAAVVPGDTLWLHGGVYRGAYECFLRGTASAPIIVRSYPGEWAIIDNGGTNNNAIWVKGAYTWFWGFEIRSSSPNPPRNEAGINFVASEGTKLINLVVHDEGATAFNPYSAATNAEIYGCIAYYNGREDDPARRNGYGIYGQNNAPSKKFVMESFFFNNFGIFQAHMAGSSAARLDDMTFTGNTFFGHTLYDYKNVIALYGNFEVGSGKNQNPEWSSNFFYRTDLLLGYNGDGVENATLTNNYLFRGSVTEHPQNTYRAKSGNVVTSTGNQVFVRPSKYVDQYEPRRANIIVFNGSGASSVSVSLPAGVLNVGDRYELRDVQNFFGSPVATGTYSGGALTVAMPGSGAPIATPQSIPVNRPGSSLPAHTANEFGAFVLMAAGSGAVPTVVSGSLSVSPVNLPSGGGSVTLSWSSQNATSASIDQGIGSVATNGTRSVQVSASTVFTLTLNGTGGPVISQASVQVAAPGLTAVTLLAPAEGATSAETSVSLSWNTVAGAGTYEVQVGTDQLFGNLTYSNTSVTTTNLQVSGLTGGMKYYWRVRAKNATVTGPYSQAWSFSTTVSKNGNLFPIDLQGLPPETDNLTLTVAKAAGMDSAYVSMWVYDADGANEGMLYVNGQDSLLLFGSIAVPARDKTVTAFTMRMSAAAWNDGTNRLRFRHELTSGFRVDSMAIAFGKSVAMDVEPMGVVPPVYALAQNYPNPFNPSTMIAFSVAKSGKATLAVFNLLGQQVATLFDSYAEPGRMYQITFEASKLASGLYLYRLEAEGATSTRKMMLVR